MTPRVKTTLDHKEKREYNHKYAVRYTKGERYENNNIFK